MNFEAPRLVRWLVRRTWSRAGAISAVLTTGVPRRALVLSTRVALLVSGSLVIAFGVSVVLWNDFGPGPLDVFIVGLRETTGMPLAVAVWAAFGLLAVLAWALGRRPGFGTLAAPGIIGATLQPALMMLDGIDPPPTFIGQSLVQIAAVGVIGVGSGALIVAGLGAGTGELLTSAASERTGHRESPVRFGFELGWRVIGVLLGGPIGPGTLYVAVLIGPAVVVGHRVVDRSVAASRRRIVASIPRAAVAEPSEIPALMPAGASARR